MGWWGYAKRKELKKLKIHAAGYSTANTVLGKPREFLIFLKVYVKKYINDKHTFFQTK